MRVSEAKFTRRYNVGQYEHEEYSLVAVLDEDDVTAAEALTQLKADVAIAYAGEASTTTETEETEEAEETEVKPKKGKKGKAAAESEEEESNDDEAGDDDSETEDSETDTESEEESEEEVSTKAKAGKAGKKFKKKPQTYSRSNETHKEIFSNVLKGVAPDWKKSEGTKSKAKKVSQDMEGEEFLDEAGEVLASFKSAVKKAMSKK